MMSILSQTKKNVKGVYIGDVVFVIMKNGEDYIAEELSNGQVKTEEY